MRTTNPKTGLRALQRAIANVRDMLTDSTGQVLLPGVDITATLNACAGDLEKLSDAVKYEMKTAMKANNTDKLNGLFFVASVSTVERATIEVVRLRAELPDVAKAYTRHDPQVSITFRAKGA